MPHAHNKIGPTRHVLADHPAEQSNVTKLLMQEPVVEHKVKSIKSFQNYIIDTLNLSPRF